MEMNMTKAPKKVAVGAKIDPDLIEQIRNAAWWVGRGYSLNSILEAGAEEELSRLEKSHNDGKPFPDAPEEATQPPRRKKQDREREPLTSVSFRMYPADRQRLKNAAVACSLTMTEILEAGVRKKLEELQKKHNKGKPFRPRESEMPHARAESSPEKE